MVKSKAKSAPHKPARKSEKDAKTRSAKKAGATSEPGAVVAGPKTAGAGAGTNGHAAIPAIAATG